MVPLRYLTVFALLLSNLACGLSGKLPSFIKPCQRNDPDINKCVLAEGRRVQKQFSEGIPEMGIDSLDPLIVGDVDPVATPGGMVFKQSNSVLTGFKNAKILDLRFDAKAKTGHSHFIGNLTMKSNYSLEGKLLLFQIKGKGDCITKIKDFDLQMDWTWEIFIGDDGKEYTRMTGYTTKFDYGKVHTKMTGLFKENKEIEDVINNFVNTNSKELLKEMGGPVIKKVEDRTAGIIVNFFKQIPYDELILV